MTSEYSLPIYLNVTPTETFRFDLFVLSWQAGANPM